MFADAVVRSGALVSGRAPLSLSRSRSAAASSSAAPRIAARVVHLRRSVVSLSSSSSSSRLQSTSSSSSSTASAASASASISASSAAFPAGGLVTLPLLRMRAAGAASLLAPRSRSGRDNASGAAAGAATGGARLLTITTASAADNSDATDAAVSAEGSSAGAAVAAPSVWQGRLLLLFVAAAYGSLTVAFKIVYNMPGPPSPGMIGAVRGIMAAMCFIPMILRSRNQTIAGEKSSGWIPKSRVFWLAAAELAFWNFTAQGACNVALLFTDATRVSFLTQASIAFTPVLVYFSGDKVPVVTWLGCMLAIAGVALLGFDGGGSAAAAAGGAAGLNVGDIIALFGAASYSLYIFRISAFAKLKLPGALTQAWKTMILAVLYCGWAAFDIFRWYAAPAAAAVAAPWAGWMNPVAWAVLAFTAIVPGYLADVCQAKGQESVSPAESQVLLAGEPLFAAVFGAVLLGEMLGP
eukprot:CAMPEP_0197577372 /NCGR_PEP_ID=MMETSP1326-20131121/2028_1 /TAXON_ID=1155430 /ORGANISM="Genus nov. species nov., Strain RCC2288" /LENGTH=466 /DNA_ID=CAMNT_0043140431 /DNA_START=181 /DNA_END=1577 /DNA_ORIENTATION=-